MYNPTLPHRFQKPWQAGPLNSNRRAHTHPGFALPRVRRLGRVLLWALVMVAQRDASPLLASPRLVPFRYSRAADDKLGPGRQCVAGVWVGIAPARGPSSSSSSSSP